MSTSLKKTKKDKSKVDIYKLVAEQIDAKLAEGTVPWRRPWAVIGVPPTNLATRKKYRGINIFLLGALSPFASPFWVSFKQAQELLFKQWCRDNEKVISDPASQEAYDALPFEERQVFPKGTKGFLNVFFKPILNKKYNPDSKDPNERRKIIFLLRYNTVFNVEQIPNLRIPAELVPEVVEDYDPIPEAQIIIDGYLANDGPSFNEGGDKAVYYPALDRVNVPLLGQFETPEEYYKTSYHELAHSTGHESRLNRRELTSLESTFGTEPYSVEELTAEMTAAMLAGVCGLEFDYDNTASYINNWRQKINDDPKVLVQAAARAQKASDLILNETPFDPDAAETTTEKEPVPA